MKLPDNLYDILKVVVWIAPGALTFVLGIINAVQDGDIIAIVTAIIGGLGAFAGGLLQRSCELYRENNAQK